MTRSVRRLFLQSVFMGLVTGALSCSLLTPLDGLSTGGNAPGDAAAESGSGSGSGSGDGSGGGGGDAGSSAGSAYASAVLADQPLAYFRLDETGGSVARSVVGSTTGTYQGKFVFGAAGAVGDGDTSATFDGETTRIDLGDALRFGGTVSFTLECWVKPSVAGSTRFIFDRRTLASPPDGYSLYFGTTYLTYSRTAHGNDFGYVGTNASPQLDVWTHVVVTFDGTTNRMFLDAAVASENQGAASGIGGGVGSFVIGDDTPGQFYKLEGQIDEVAIYDKALDASRILAHYQAAKH